MEIQRADLRRVCNTLHGDASDSATRPPRNLEALLSRQSGDAVRMPSDASIDGRISQRYFSEASVLVACACVCACTRDTPLFC